MTTPELDPRRPGRRPVYISIALHVVVVLLALYAHHMAFEPIEFVAYEVEMVTFAPEELDEFSLAPPEELVIETPDDPAPEEAEIEPEPVVDLDPIPEPDSLPPPDPDPPEEVVEEPPTEEPPPEDPPSEVPPPETETEDVASEDMNIRMEGLQRDFPEYYAEIQTVVARCLREPPGVRGVTAVLRFEIQQDGSIPGSSIRVHQPSGNSRFDIAAIGAVECAGSDRLSPLPAEFPIDALQVEFRFSPRGE